MSVFFKDVCLFSVLQPNLSRNQIKSGRFANKSPTCTTPNIKTLCKQFHKYESSNYSERQGSQAKFLCINSLFSSVRPEHSTYYYIEPSSYYQMPRHVQQSCQYGGNKNAICVAVSQAMVFFIGTTQSTC